MIDDDARYLRSHEWARQDEEGVFTVGLSKYAIDQLGDIVYMELPKEGESFENGAIFGLVESVKAASDMYMPVGGEIVEVNEEIPDNPDILKDDPYEEGWLIRVKVSNPKDFEELMDADAYRKYLETDPD